RAGARPPAQRTGGKDRGSGWCGVRSVEWAPEGLGLPGGGSDSGWFPRFVVGGTTNFSHWHWPFGQRPLTDRAASVSRCLTIRPVIVTDSQPGIPTPAAASR